jgi:adenylate cyclase
MRVNVEEKLAAVMAAEVPEYERLVAGDRVGPRAELQLFYHEVIDAAIGMYGGRIFELEPDHTLAEFDNPQAALRCAVEIQQGLNARNAEFAPEERISLRIGVHYGPVVVDRGELSGEGLTIAGRVKALAAPGEVCVSRTVVDHVKPGQHLGYDDLATIPGRPVPRAALAFRVRVAPLKPPLAHPRLATAGRLALTVFIAAAAIWLAMTGGGPQP